MVKGRISPVAYVLLFEGVGGVAEGKISPIAYVLLFEGDGGVAEGRISPIAYVLVDVVGDASEIINVTSFKSLRKK